MAEGIESATFYQALDDPFVNLPQIDPFAEIMKRFEFTALPACCEDGLHGADPHILYCGQTEADLAIRDGEIAA